MSRSRYSIDTRRYKGVFKPGFFAHLSATKFWQSRLDPYERPKRLRRNLIWVFIIIAAIGFTWLIVRSISALEVF